MNWVITFLVYRVHSDAQNGHVTVQLHQCMNVDKYKTMSYISAWLLINGLVHQPLP